MYYNVKLKGKEKKKKKININFIVKSFINIKILITLIIIKK